MSESIRTLTFVGVAVASIAVAWIVHASLQPDEPEAFAKVGIEFYPDFTDPTKAGSLKIADFDEKSAKVHEFTVEFKNGRWRIPSHYGYPADAKDRLEKAAASLIGITRKSLAGRRANSHERFGVMDPLGKDATKGDGLGQRILIKDRKGNVLADYILGKRVAGQDNLYFVRKPDEDETYRAEIDLNVSTKFADWVEQDLLKLDRNDLLSMEVKTPRFETEQTLFGVNKVLTGEDSIKVSRDETGPGTKWKFDGLNPETEEINTSGISSIETALDGLELKGVRQKPQGLTPDLTLDLDAFPKDQNPQQHFNTVQLDLSSRGFMLGGVKSPDSEEQRFLLFGEGGEMVAQSDEGLVYHLHFGKAFSGTDAEIEVGKTGVADEEGKAVAETPKDAEADKSKSSLNRYLFIRVGFDESLLGKPPVKPEEPKRPEGLGEESGAAKTAGNQDEKSKEDGEQAKLQAEYKTKMAIYRADLSRYEKDQEEYDKKVKEGKAKEAELNDRFGDWYYVVTNSSYDNLMFKREDVVKEKSKDGGTTSPEAPPFGNLPGGNPFIPGPPMSKEPNGEEPKPAVADKPAAPAKAAKPETAPEPK